MHKVYRLILDSYGFVLKFMLELYIAPTYIEN